MKLIKQIVALAASSALLSGCASHNWSPGPNAKGTFEEAKGQCTLMANHSGTGFAAAGSPGFVAGASVGAAIGEGIRAQNDFNACMSASGWVADDLKPADIEKLKVAVKVATDEAKACVATARANPKYSSIQSHLVDPAVGRYTFTQMADDKIPTVEEATLFSSLEDEAEQCRSIVIQKVTALNPFLGSKLNATFGAGREIVLLLATRKISWGEHAKRLQALQDSLAGQKT